MAPRKEGGQQNRKKKGDGAPQAEVTIRVSSAIVAALVAAHAAGESVNLNALKAQVAKKLGSAVIPRLIDVIAAVPQELREILLPKLRAKPVRTASGVSYLQG